MMQPTASGTDGDFAGDRDRDTLAVTAAPQDHAMIIIECSWCDGELALEAIDAQSVDCPDCGISLDIAPDESTQLPAAA
jgi:Zn finger protein HypA/HybF involved in hydrogenase expression